MAGGLSLVDAGAIVSIALWLTIVMAPVGGFMAQKSGRPNLILGLSLAAIGPAVAAVSMWDAPVLLFVIAGLLGGLPPGIIMALPARAVRGRCWRRPWGFISPAITWAWVCCRPSKRPAVVRRRRAPLGTPRLRGFLLD